MRFESRLAARIAAKRHQEWPWRKIAGAAFIVFIVLTLTASTSASAQASIHMSSKNAAAHYMKNFDEKHNVLLIGTSSSQGWVTVKVPFRGHLSELQEVSFSEFLVSTGGMVETPEPYVVVKLPRGNNLVCHPEMSYSDAGWSLPYFMWQLRDTISDGKWTQAPSAKDSEATSLVSWASSMQDPSVMQIVIVVGGWQIENPYKVYIGDLSVNGSLVDLSNAKRTFSGDPDPVLGL